MLPDLSCTLNRMNRTTQITIPTGCAQPSGSTCIAMGLDRPKEEVLRRELPSPDINRKSVLPISEVCMIGTCLSPDRGMLNG